MASVSSLYNRDDRGSTWTAVPQGMHLYAIAIRGMMISMAFFNNIDLARVDRSTAEGFTLQAMVKVGLLLIASLLGGWGWWKSREVRGLLWTLPGILLIGLGIWYFASLPTSIGRKVSLSAGVLFWGSMLFCVSGMRYVGGNRLMLDICIGQFLFLLLSVLLYLVSPQSAMFTEILNASTEVPRFGGLGHPNVTGRISVFLGLLLFAGAIQHLVRWRTLILCLPLLIGVCIASMSRTPVIAGVLALAIVGLPLLRQPIYIYLLGIALFLGLLGYIAVESLIGTDLIFSNIIQSSTKTGSVEEVTTMTGRTVIWQFVFEKIGESPIFGFGAGSTPVLMAGLAGHAHNILLQPTVSMGIPAGILTACLLLWNVYSAFRLDLPLLRMTVVFILTLGIAETPLFNPLPESVSLMWFVICFWPVATRWDQENVTTYRPLDRIAPSTS